MVYKKSDFILVAIFIFPGLIATTKFGGAIYALILLFGLALGWSAWKTLESWEKRVLVGFVLFFLLLSISIINTQDMQNGIKRLGRLIHFPLIIPMYLLLKKYQIETGKFFLMGAAFSTVVMFGLAFYQVVILGWDRAIGATNAIMLGDIAMLIAVIIACSLLTVAKTWKHYFTGAVAIVLAISASILTVAKGAWVLVPVIIIWFLWLKRKDMDKVSLILVAAVSVVSIVGLLNVDKVKNRLNVALTEYELYTENPGLNNTSSIGPRIEMWRDSITIWQSNPVLGTGLGDYATDRYNLYKNGESNLEVAYAHAHSIYFEVLSTAGMLGLISMVVLMLILPFKAFYSFWLKEQNIWIKFYALSGMATIIAFAIFGLTEAWVVRNAFVRMYLICILVFMSSIALISSKKRI